MKSFVSNHLHRNKSIHEQSDQLFYFHLTRHDIEKLQERIYTGFANFTIDKPGGKWQNFNGIVLLVWIHKVMKSLSKNWFTIISFLIPVTYLILFRMIFPPHFCDDAYITFKSAINLTEGNGLTFNSGERIYVVTAPLWAFILAAGKLCGFEMLDFVRFAGISFEIAFLCSLVYLGYSLFGNYRFGLLTAVLLCTHPVYLFNTFSGMETSLYLFVITISLIFTAKERCGWALAWASLSVWIRFDGLLFFLIIFFWVIYKAILKDRNKTHGAIVLFIFSFIILIAYFLFGLIYYNSVIPNSVLAKSLHSPSLFSSEWFHGAYKILRQIGNAIILGRSTYFYPYAMRYWIFAIAIILGIIKTVMDRKITLIPSFGFSILYSICFILSGDFAAQFYPWYFAPPLLGAYLMASYGFMWFVDFILSMYTKGFRPDISPSIVLIAVVITWLYIIFGPLSADSRNLDRLEYERERVYKTGSIWAGKYLPQNTTVAAYEIGVIGYYLRDDIKLIDLYGIHRKKDERMMDMIDIIEKYNPEMILVGEQNECRETIENGLPGEYIWMKYEKLDIGLRKEISKSMLRNFREIGAIDKNME